MLDYEVSFDQATDGASYVILASNILSNSYEASSLTSGSTYKFKVQARNSFDLSVYSTEL